MTATFPMSRVALLAYPDAINDRMPDMISDTALRLWKTGRWSTSRTWTLWRRAIRSVAGQPGLAYGIVLGGGLVHAVGLSKRYLGGRGTGFRYGLPDRVDRREPPPFRDPRAAR